MRIGRQVVVTGAAGGIGRLVTQRFLDNGDGVIAVDRDRAGLEALSPSPRLRTLAADITQDVHCQAVADAARDASGHVDVLINIAGWYPIQPFDELDGDDFRKVVDVNLTGAFLMIRAIWPLMKGRGWGRIVSTGSGSIYEGVADQLPYVAAKAGLAGLTRSFARIAAEEGVTVNLVAPGLTSTRPVREALSHEQISEAAQARALQREEYAQDLVGAYAFLASPDADFITAQTLLVDGGAHML